MTKVHHNIDSGAEIMWQDNFSYSDQYNDLY